MDVYFIIMEWEENWIVIFLEIYENRKSIIEYDYIIVIFGFEGLIIESFLN